MGPLTSDSKDPCQMETDDANSRSALAMEAAKVEDPNSSGETELLTIPSFEERLRVAYLKNDLYPHDMKVMLNKDRMFRVHKHIFMVASPEFMLLTHRAMKEAGRLSGEEVSVKLPVDADIFRIIYRFMYLKDVNHENISFPGGMDQALSVLETSVIFRIFQMKQQMIGKVISLMDRDNVLRVLAVAKRFSQGSPEFKELEEKALTTIRQNGEYVIGSEDFLDLGVDDVCRILSSDNLRVKKEILVFNAAMRWADRKARKNLTTDAARSYFSQVKDCIRFPLMSAEDLGIVAVHDRLLDPMFLYEVFKFVSLPASMKHLASTTFDVKLRNHLACTQSKTCKPEVQSEESSSPSTTTTEVIVNEAMPPPATPIPLSPQQVRKKRRLSGGNRVSFADDVLGKSDDSDDDWYAVIKRQDAVCHCFDDLFKGQHKRKNKGIRSFYFKNITIEHPYSTAHYERCNKLHQDFKLQFLMEEATRCKHLIEFLSYFDLRRHLAPFNPISDRPLTYEQIWSMNQDVLIKFNGVTFFKIERGQKTEDETEDETASIADSDSCEKPEMVLNYIRDSCKILSNADLKVAKLAMSNCEFSPKVLKDRTVYIKILNLYRCWGEYNLMEILSGFPNLEELYCWKWKPKHIPDLGPNQDNHRKKQKNNVFAAGPVLDLSSLLTTPKLRKLVLYKVLIQIPSRTNSDLTSEVTELVLDHCSMIKARYSENRAHSFGEIFKKLTRLGIQDSQSPFEYNPGDCAVSDIINQALQLGSLEWLKVYGMKWTAHQDQGVNVEDETLLNFLQANGLQSSAEKPRSFLFKKNTRGRSTLWDVDVLGDVEKESPEVDGGDWSRLDLQEYEWYALNDFYDSVEAYEDYFLQDGDNFPNPKPHLWV